jgi:cobalt-zinc-cadmium efflux system outer membrane protein
MKKTGTTLFFLLQLVGLCAQSPDSLLLIARQNNPGLQAGYALYKAMLEKSASVRQWPEPEANLGFIAWPSPNESLLPTATLGWMQPIPWKGMINLKGDIVQTEARAALEQVDMQWLEIRYELRQAYWTCFAAERRAERIRENILLLQSLERLVQMNIERGTAALTDVLEVQMRILELEQEVLRAENARREPIAQINRLLGRAASEPVAVHQTADFALFALHPDSLLARLLLSYPGLSTLYLAREASRQRQELNRIESRPGIAAGLDYAVMQRAGGIHPGDGQDMWMPRVGVRVPLFRETYRARDREEQLLQTAWEAQEREVRNMLSASVEQALAKLREAQLSFELARQQRPLLEAALRVQTDAYSANSSGLESLLRYEESLLKITLSEIEAIAESHKALAELERRLK